jgi:hypothetical protein
MNWTPQKHAIVKSEEIKNTLHETGYVTAGNIGPEKLAELKELYKQLHQFKSDKGGMFYSLYSDDIAYRKTVHDKIGEILYPVYNTIFANYKSVINSFIVKVPGPESEFALHQDSSGLDELRYSALSLWMPLQDTNLDNGCLCVVPKSHKMFYPFRGISMNSPFGDIQDEVRKYLLPLDMKAGDLFMFDNRLVHYSPANIGVEDRIVVMSGLFPQEAPIEVCYRDETAAGSAVEVYAQSEDYLLTNTTFFHNCTCRPETGYRVREIAADLHSWTREEFLAAARKAGITEANVPQLLNLETRMSIISEPV